MPMPSSNGCTFSLTRHPLDIRLKRRGSTSFRLSFFRQQIVRAIYYLNGRGFHVSNHPLSSLFTQYYYFVSIVIHRIETVNNTKCPTTVTVTTMMRAKI
jgi:hypothetical protein